MNASLLYRIASGLLVLFAAGHTLGFRQVDPRWGIDPAIQVLKTTRFDVQGVSRTYRGFYTGFGLFMTVLLLFAAVLAWLLGGLSREVLATMSGIAWALALCFVAVTVLRWQYFFIVAVIFSGWSRCAC